MKKKIEKLRKFLEEEFKGVQAFNTRNTVGDRMVTVYDDDGIIVDYCPGWLYIEIFGITEEEYQSLSDIIDCC